MKRSYYYLLLSIFLFLSGKLSNYMAPDKMENKKLLAKHHIKGNKELQLQ